MKQDTAKFNLGDLKRMLEQKTLTWDESVQRCCNAWKPLQKSELIHSLLANYYIPSICLLRTIVVVGTKGKTKSIYSVLDGKQRLSVLVDFMNDKFLLHKRTPDLILPNGEKYTLAKKKYSQLDIKLQTIIETYVPSIITLEECTPEETEMLFYRLNNGTPLTKVQQSRAVLGIEGAAFINSLLEFDFFDKCNLTTFQRSREDDLSSILLGIMLMDENYQWQTFGANELSNYCKYLRDNFNVELQCKILSTIKFLTDVFSDANVDAVIKKDDKKKFIPFLKKISIPIIIKVASIMEKYDIKPVMALMFFAEFFDENSNVNKKYQKECGQGSITKAKVTGRVDIMTQAMYDSKLLDFTIENHKMDELLEETKKLLEASGDSYIPQSFIDKYNS